MAEASAPAYPRSCIGPAYSADSMDSVVGGYYDPRVIPADQIIQAQQRQIAAMQSRAYAQVRSSMLQSSAAISNPDDYGAQDDAAYSAWQASQ